MVLVCVRRHRQYLVAIVKDTSRLRREMPDAKWQILKLCFSVSGQALPPHAVSFTLHFPFYPFISWSNHFENSLCYWAVWNGARCSRNCFWDTEKTLLAGKLEWSVIIRYDTRCYFNVRSKADMGQLNLPRRTDN